MEHVAIPDRQTVLTTAWRTRLYRPAFRAWQRGDYWHEGSPAELQPVSAEPYKGPVAVLTSARSYSAAEDFAAVFAGMKRGVIVGEPTGGSTGQPLSFALPGGGSARVCTKGDRFADGRQFVGVGIQPEIVARPSVADVRAGRDRVLEAALAALEKR